MSIQKPLNKIILGKPMDVQLSPFGEYPGTLDGKRRVQVCDAEAFQNVVANFTPEAGRLLVDFEHDQKDTTAAGWIRGVRVDPEDGLIGSIEFTDAGADAVNNKRLLFISADWDVDLTTNRPIRLLTSGLTNRPNIPVRPILNKADPDTSKPVEGQGKPKMTETAKLLGLDPETATDADIAAAVKALQDKLAAQAAEALTAEAENCAVANEGRIKNKADFIASYVANPALTKSLLGALAAPTAEAKAEPAVGRIVNKADAQTPSFASRKAGDVLATYESLKGKERSAFLSSHAQEIVDARKAQQ